MIAPTTLDIEEIIRRKPKEAEESHPVAEPAVDTRPRRPEARCLRVLVLAPHPFLIDRGSPIDLGLVLRGLSRRGAEVDVVCYAEGREVDLPGVTLHRIPDKPFLREMRPGFSLRKLFADAYLFSKARQLVARHSYDLVHAGEEGVFMARWFQLSRRLPYVYDLDSSIPQQLVEKMPWLRPLSWLFTRAERAVVGNAAGCLPVCNALGDLCLRHGARLVEVLHDISLLEEAEVQRLLRDPPGNLRASLGLEPGDLIAMYVGNLEPYQGIDLLLDAMVELSRTPAAPRLPGEVSSRTPSLHLVVAGGRADDIAQARARVRNTEAESRVHFLGASPLEELATLLVQGDLLIAPRIRGVNTPMKVFSYLHTGRCVLVTDLPTHTQVLHAGICAFAAPTADAFARRMDELARDSETRARLGAAGRAFALGHHTFEAYCERLDRFYDEVTERLRAPGAVPGAAAMAEGGLGSLP